MVLSTQIDHRRSQTVFEVTREANRERIVMVENRESYDVD